MRSFLNNTIRILFHISENQPGFVDGVFEQVKEFVGVLNKELSYTGERWIKLSDHSIPNVIKEYTSDTIHELRADYDETKYEVYALSAEVYYSLGAKKSKVIFSANLKKSDLAPAHDGREYNFEILFTKAVWDRINLFTFITAVQKTCCKLNVMYACVDLGSCVPRKIRQSMFRIASNISDQTNVYSYLPGIFWGQYITPQMCEKIGMNYSFLDNAPCSLVQDISSYEARGKWLQISSKVWTTSREQRLLLREYFSKYLYPVSTERIAGLKHDPFSQFSIDLLPLKDEEIMEINNIKV